ncbi:hypothetical protein ES708_07289 [subsurface metagenome]
MGKDDNNPKTATEKVQADSKAVIKEPADKNSPITLEEAQAVTGAEEGKIEEAIEKERLKGDTDIAEDLKDLKKEQVEKKEEIREKKEEVKEAEKEVKEETAIPSKFEGKTDEERLKIYQDMESSFTKISQKNKELEQKVEESDEINKKIDEYEKSAVIKKQKAAPIKLPPYPSNELFYENPEEYNKKVKEYNDAKINAMVSPLYGQNWDSQKQNNINKLKENTEKDLVPYKDVEIEVESRLKKNPALINQYGLAAREVIYNQVRNEMIPQKVEDIEKMAVEKAKQELKEETDDKKKAEVMSSDITTQRREGKPVDLEEMLDSGIEPEKVISAFKKKHKVDFQS